MRPTERAVVEAAIAFANASSPPKFIDPGPARDLVEAVEGLDAEMKPAPASDDPLGDRRQLAREAYYDRYELGDNIGGSARRAALRECIETATRVRITPEVVAVAEGEAGDSIEQDPRWMNRALAAAFRAAGFEVEE